MLVTAGFTKSCSHSRHALRLLAPLLLSTLSLIGSAAEQLDYDTHVQCPATPYKFGPAPAGSPVAIGALSGGLSSSTGRGVAARSLLQHLLEPWQVLLNTGEAGIAKEDVVGQGGVEQPPSGGAKPNLSGAQLCWTPPHVLPGGLLEKDNTSMIYVSPKLACPKECPFSQPLDDDPCYKACVIPQYCKALHPFRVFADNVSNLCTASCGFNIEDVIPGCMECESPGICKRCSVMTTRSSDGRQCHDYWIFIWMTIYIMGAVGAVAYVFYLLYLQCRPITNYDKLAYATVHREACMPWRRRDDAGRLSWEKFSLFTKTWDTDVSGLGTILYFRWMVFLLFVALFFCVSLGMTYNIPFEELSFSISRFNIADFSVYFSEVLAPQTCPSEIEQIPKDALDVVALQSAAATNASVNTSLVAADFLLEEEEEILQHSGSGSGARAGSQSSRPRIRSFRKINLRMKPKVRPRASMGENRDPWEMPAGTMEGFRIRMSVSNLIIYLVVAVASLAFSRRQSAFAKDWDNARPSHKQYTLLVKGLQPSDVDAQELQKFLQDVLDKNVVRKPTGEVYKVIGVSVAYDYYAHKIVINNALLTVTEAWSDTYDDRHNRTFGEDSMERPFMPRRGSSGSATPRARAMSFIEQVTLSLEKAADAADQLRPGNKGTDPNMCSEEELLSILEGLKSHGYAYAVFSSLQAREAFESIISRTDLTFKGHALTVEVAKTDPHGVLWENFSAAFCGTDKVARHAGVFVVLMLIWVGVYVPYAVYNMLAVVVDGEMSHFQDTVLGALIAAGNALVTITIEVMVRQFGCVNKDRRESITMYLIYMAMTVNTAFDVFIVMLVLQSMAESMAVYGTLDVMHYHRILAKELFRLIVPGYIITPYLICPIFEDILPYWIERRRIRSTPKIPRPRAEERYRYKEFDITWRYSDLLTNFTICLAAVMYSTHHMYAIMVWVVAYIVLVYVFDQWRLVRCTSKTFITTGSLHEAFAFWWAIPVGFLGSISLHWWLEASGIRETHTAETVRIIGYAVMGIFMVFHCAIYWTILYFQVKLLPDPPSHTVMYQDMCESRLCDLDGATFFNTNPVYVLKTWLSPEAFPEAERNCMPYVQGKEHLQTAAADDAAGSKAAAVLKSRLRAIDAKTDLTKC